MKDELLEKLKLEYKNIIENKTELSVKSDFEIWRSNRLSHNELRNDFYYYLNDITQENIDYVYPFYLSSITNYHDRKFNSNNNSNSNNNNNYNNNDYYNNMNIVRQMENNNDYDAHSDRQNEEILETKQQMDIDSIITNNYDNNLPNNIQYNRNNTNQSNLSNQSIKDMVFPDEISILQKRLEKEQISKFIKNDIFNKIITDVVEKNSIKKKSIPKIIPKFKNQSTIINEINEIINRIGVLISENSESQNQFDTPIKIIIQELFYDIIIKQYKIVNKCFIMMLKTKYDLSLHLKTIEE